MCELPVGTKAEMEKFQAAFHEVMQSKVRGISVHRQMICGRT